MPFYKGYIQTFNKEAGEKFKGRKHFDSLDRVQQLSEYAGVLAKDTILVDVDDFEQSEILLKIVQDFNLVCRVYKTTRGKHFLFQNSGVTKCGTHLKLAIGLEADIKIGSKNSYEVVKFGGVEREILYDTATDENAQPLPKWLRPLAKNVDVDFVSMETGDGRNQTLFNYILTLQSNDYSKDEARETIRILNKYVLKDPLPDNELETVLRDDAFKKATFFDDKKFLHDKFGNFLISNDYVIKINNQLHVYKDGVYVPGDKRIENVMLKYLPGLPKAKRTEVLAYLDVQIDADTPTGGAQFIAFRNGLYNVATNTLTDFSADHIVTNKIPWDYDPNVYSEEIDTIFDNITCHDGEVRNLIEESIGYCFYRHNELGKAFILTGEKSNGKSTFLSLVQNLLGDENTCALDLKELGDRFKTAEMFGKLANIGDDISDEFIANPAVFKKLCTGNRVSAEKKGRDPFEFNNYAKMFYSANNIPRIKDRTGAVLRRLIIIPFNAKFDKYTPGYKPFIIHDLVNEVNMSYMINLGIAGLNRVLENKEFTESVKVKNAMDEYEKSNNPIIGFLQDCKDDDFQIENTPTNDVYDRYRMFCNRMDLKPMSNIEFSKQINRRLNFKVVDKFINKKKRRIFVEKDGSEKS